MKDIENIELLFLKKEDYPDLKKAMIEIYPDMEGAYWGEKQINTLIDKFPEGQVVLKINNEFAGCALSILVVYDNFDDHHTYR